MIFTCGLKGTAQGYTNSYKIGNSWQTPPLLNVYFNLFFYRWLCEDAQAVAGVPVQLNDGDDDGDGGDCGDGGDSEEQAASGAAFQLEEGRREDCLSKDCTKNVVLS